MTAHDVRRLRDRCGGRPADLAGRLGVYPMTLSRWERGAMTVRGPMMGVMRLLVETALTTNWRR